MKFMFRVALSLFICITSLFTSCDFKNVKMGKIEKSSEVPKLINNVQTMRRVFLGADIRLNPSKIYVINFGESWCVPCIREFKYLNQLKNKFGNDTNVVFLFITKSKEVDFNRAKGFSEFSFMKIYNSSIYDTIGMIEIQDNSLLSVESTSLPMTIIIKNNKIDYKFLEELSKKNISVLSDRIKLD